MTRDGAGIVKGLRPAMSLPQHLREIRAFLVACGAINIRLTNGSKHDRFEFEANGQTHKYPVPRPHSKTGDTSGDYQIAALRRLLGDPQPVIRRERRTLDQLAAELPPAAPALPLIFVD